MRSKRIWRRLNGTLVVACLLAMACPSRFVLAATSAKIVIAHTGMNARTVVFWTAQEQKFLASNGTEER